MRYNSSHRKQVLFAVQTGWIGEWDMLDIEDSKFDIFDNRSTLEDQLIPLIKNNRIIPFVGAGLSIGIYGSWGAALKNMMRRNFNGREAEATEIETMISCGAYEESAQKIHDVLRPSPFRDRLVVLFKESLIKDEDLKKMSVRFLPRIFQESLVVTTNFDKVLERAFLMEQRSFEEKMVLRHLTDWQAVRVRRNSKHYLIKIHGCVSAPDEVVMTKTQYDEFYDNSSKHIKRLRGILSGNNLLFIGCGLKEDRTVELLRGVDSGDHYAILPMNGKPGDDAFEERRAFMADLNMHCIWYPKDEYQYVEDILEYIYAAITDQHKAVKLAAKETPQDGQDLSTAPTKKSPQPIKPFTKPLVKNEVHAMGKWNGKSLEWLVLDVQKDRALLLAKDCLLTAPYNKELEQMTWAECSLRNETLPRLTEELFDDDEHSRVLLVKNKNPYNEAWSTQGGTDTDDKLFLLSIDEAKQYFPYNKARIARLNGGTVSWWLRSPGYSCNGSALVDHGGNVLENGYYVSWSSCAVRPAFWLNLQS